MLVLTKRLLNKKKEKVHLETSVFDAGNKMQQTQRVIWTMRCPIAAILVI